LIGTIFYVKLNDIYIVCSENICKKRLNKYNTVRYVYKVSRIGIVIEVSGKRYYV
jgi:hypothetical protein